MFGRHFCRAACCRAQCSHIAMPTSPRKNVIFLSSFTAFHLFSILYVVVQNSSTSICLHSPSGSIFSPVSVHTHGSQSYFSNSGSNPKYRQSAHVHIFFFHSFSAYCLNLYLTFPCRCGKLFHGATPRVLKAQPQRPWVAG